MSPSPGYPLYSRHPEQLSAKRAAVEQEPDVDLVVSVASEQLHARSLKIGFQILFLQVFVSDSLS